jgi:hypothetical protein
VKPPRRGDVVEVAWVDSEHINLGWEATGQYRRAARRNPEAYRTSGYWLDRVKGRVVIVQSLSLYNRHVSEVMSIPEVAVTDMRVLGRSNKRVRKALR